MKFKNYKNTLERPFIVIADLESSLEKTGREDRIHKHVPNSCCYYFMCSFDPSRNALRAFEGEDCVEDMIVELKELADACVLEMKGNEEMVMTARDTEYFKDATCCGICKDPFKKDDVKVRDHCHRTGKFRGATHQKCNINYFSNRYLPVVFHNLRGYDSHFIIKKAYDISNRLENPRIDCIPNSYEKFMSFSIGRSLKFIDSLQFMASSLEKLVENLYDGEDKFKNFANMKKYYPDDLDLLCRKGYYPYEWMDSAEKLDHEGLPEMEHFYSALRKEGIDEEGYAHARNVYEKLECRTFRDYHTTYLKCDVLLLADVFENFRKTCMNYYGMDPANYLSAPSLAWDAMLRMTGIELELISNPEILDIVEKQKRGGLCFVGSKRHVKANNRDVEGYDAEKPENYLMYWDANNLYGWAMSQPLPYKNLRLRDDVLLEEILGTADDAETGFIVECDLHFPKEIHDKLKEFPPCPESLNIPESMLSTYQKETAKQNNMKFSKTSTKLVSHLMDRKGYCIDYRNLKYVSDLGVQITKIHRVVSYSQKAWLKPYIDFNTDKRKEAKNEFEKDFFKLMNNAVFGKTMENVKNRINLHLTTDEQNAVKWFSKINFKTGKSFDNLYLIEMYKQEIIYDKPIYVGTTILDLSKLHMLKFHYEVIDEQFKGHYNLIYTDTDSLVYSIFHPNIYGWVKENKQHFDLSDSVNINIKDQTNKKALGMFKDELNGVPMTEFTALNPKAYCFKTVEVDTLNPEVYAFEDAATLKSAKKTEKTKKGKGVSRVVLKKEITNEDYKQVLETGESLSKDIHAIRSFNHEVFTIKTNKKCLTNFYDKMYMTGPNDCLPFGHFSIQKIM